MFEAAMRRQQRRPNFAVERLRYCWTVDANVVNTGCTGWNSSTSGGPLLIEPSLDMVSIVRMTLGLAVRPYSCRRNSAVALSLPWHSVSWCSRGPLQELDCCWSASRLLHSSGMVQLLSITLHSAVRIRANLDCHQHAALLNQTRTST